MDFNLEWISQFGAWGVLTIVMLLQMRNQQNQSEKDREERLAESERHDSEVTRLTEVINNNTVALTKLTAYIEKGVD